MRSPADELRHQRAGDMRRLGQTAPTL
ncbi:hypothetical protein HF086_016089 [Spodoptera exigua]|uniref:Uncharacterized protein n=1 Tax=Spodoptera exigua TaxID=7107 RepID=A0A922M694_SPOEX|nr:hypothetical protein HF086_016089 [Spodoptera exigua]